MLNCIVGVDFSEKTGYNGICRRDVFARLKKKMYICNNKKYGKMRYSFILMFLLFVSCAGESQRMEVRFCPREGANPASTWTLMGIACDTEDPLWIRMEREDGKGEPVEWKIAGGMGVECLYLPPAAPGRYLLRASLKKGGPWLAEIVVLRSDTVMVFDCDENFFQIGTEGFMLDAVSGKPIPGVEVKVTDYEDSTWVRTVSTDSTGAYRLVDLVPWKEYVVESGSQVMGIIYQGDAFGRYRFYGDTLRIVGRGISPEGRLMGENGRKVASVRFKPNDLGIGEAMALMPKGDTFYLILDQNDSVPVVRPDTADNATYYYPNSREIQTVPSEDNRFRFTVASHGNEPFRTTVHVDVMRIDDPQPWRMNTFISTPILAKGFHHSIDSAEFARRFPYLLMDTLNRHSLSELPAFTLADSYDIAMSLGDTASVDLSKLAPGSYRIVLQMPLPEGSVDSVDRFFYHYHTPGYRLGSGPFYADIVGGRHLAVGDTLRVKVGSCYRGVTVMCQVEENGKVLEVKQLEFNDNDTVLALPLRRRGVVQMKFLSMWQGEFLSWTASVDVGRTRLDWYWDELYSNMTFDLSRQYEIRN